MKPIGSGKADLQFRRKLSLTASATDSKLSFNYDNLTNCFLVGSAAVTNTSFAGTYLPVDRGASPGYFTPPQAASGCQVAAQVGNWSGGMGRAMP